MEKIHGLKIYRLFAAAIIGAAARTATAGAAAAGTTAIAVIIIVGRAAAVAAAAMLRAWLRSRTAMVMVTRVIFLAWREEFINREVKAREYLTWVFCAVAADTGVTAILLWHADIVCRHQQLDIALELDDGELTDCDNQLVAGGIQSQILTAEAAADRTRHFTQLARAAAMAWLGRINNTGIEQDRINSLEYSGWTVGALCKLAIHLVWAVLRGEDTRMTFAAKQDAALVIDRKTFQNTRTTNTGACLYRDLVVEADVNTVEAALECNRLDIHHSSQQLSRARLDAHCIAVDKALILDWQIYAKIAHAVTAAALVINLFCMHTNRFTETSCTIYWAGTHFFSHKKNLRIIECGRENLLHQPMRRSGLRLQIF